MAKIGIIALGYVGQRLYTCLEEKKYDVLGTYHSFPKGVANEIRLDYTLGIVQPELLLCDTIVFNLTPSVINHSSYFEKFIQNFKDKRIIFISSTSVYGEQGQVNEKTMLHPNSENGKLLLSCESILEDYNSVIVRSAGIIGPDRHPAFSLAGRSFKVGEKEVVNLIDVKDLTQVIVKCVESDFSGTVNAVNIHHPQKIEYYKSYCIHNNLAAPNFVVDNQRRLKSVATIYDEFIVNTPLPN